jgi:hypothetical protein
MKTLTLILSLFLSSFSFGQHSDIEDFINQITKKEVPENFDYYYLVPISLQQPIIYDSLKNFQIRELRTENKDFPVDLLYEENNKTTNWKNYNFKKAKYVPKEYIYNTSPPTITNVQFVKYNIKQLEYDNLMKNKKPHTLVVKKKWFWNKKRIFKNKKFYNELIKVWKKDKKEMIEEKIYFQFSQPIFSKDKKYARISISKNQRCNGNGFTALYKNDNGTWMRLIEFNQFETKTVTTHIRCEELILNYK